MHILEKLYRCNKCGWVSLLVLSTREKNHEKDRKRYNLNLTAKAHRLRFVDHLLPGYTRKVSTLIGYFFVVADESCTTNRKLLHFSEEISVNFLLRDSKNANVTDFCAHLYCGGMDERRRFPLSGRYQEDSTGQLQ